MNLKIFANITVAFAAVGFITYVLIIITSFFGCCTHISNLLFYQIILALIISATVLFSYCLYNNCYRKVNRPESNS